MQTKYSKWVRHRKASSMLEVQFITDTSFIQTARVSLLNSFHLSLLPSAFLYWHSLKENWWTAVEQTEGTSTVHVNLILWSPFHLISSVIHISENTSPSANNKTSFIVIKLLVYKTWFIVGCNKELNRRQSFRCFTDCISLICNTMFP